MNWTPLESSVLTAVAYSHDDHSLYLEFRSGAIYCYFDFPLYQYDEFLAAESKGRYFSADIRDRYRCQRVRLLTGRARR
jgi:hypothetical protein